MSDTEAAVTLSVKWPNLGRMQNVGECSVNLRNFLVYLGFAELEIVAGLQKVHASLNLYELLASITSFLNDLNLKHKKYQLIFSGDSIEISRTGSSVRMKIFDYLKRSDVEVTLTKVQICELQAKMRACLISFLEGILPSSVQYETSEIDLI